MKTPLKRIAVDIDDVLASTLHAARLWANEQTGLNLEAHHYSIENEYWSYYDTVWTQQGLGDRLVFNDFLIDIEHEKTDIETNEGAKNAIKTLLENYEVIFMTSRPPAMKDVTRKWLDAHIDPSVPLYLSHNPYLNQSAQSKGEMCVELGVGLLIDDSIDNCQSAVDAGIEAIVFGDYGWNKNVPDSMEKCVDWTAVLEQVHGR